jgi:hypothetical protein
MPARKAPKKKKKAVAAKKKAISKPKRVANKKKAASKPKPKPRAQARKRAPSSAPISSPRPSVPIAPPIASESSPRPADSALAAISQIPSERPLTDEEREAMRNVATTAQRYMNADGVPEKVVRAIGAFVDEVRAGKKPEPKGQDIRLGLGVLWGEQVRAQVGWRWVHLTYPNGFASYALVPDDRAFACFPLNRLPELMKSGHATNTSARLFQRIKSGELPTRRENAYLVIG